MFISLVSQVFSELDHRFPIDEGLVQMRQNHIVPYRAAILCFSLFLLGCGTTRFSDTQRTATEQLLISSAVDDVVSRMNFSVLAGKKVFFEEKYLDGYTDNGYVVSSVRQQLLAHGAWLMEKKEEADYIVEARCGAIGTDRHDLLIGVPRMQLPAVVPGQPSFIPEIPFAKKSHQKGVAKIAVYAFNRKTGRPLWQSGVVQESSLSKDLWVLGAGPFQRGTFRKKTEFAAEVIEIPFFDESQETESGVGIAVTQSAVWEEPKPGMPNQHHLIRHDEAIPKEMEAQLGMPAPKKMKLKKVPAKNP